MIDFAALLDAIHDEPRPFRHGVSDLGKCVRARVYDGLGVKGEPGEYATRGVLAAAQGSAMDAVLGATAERLGLGKAQVPVEWGRDGVRVTGTADLVTDTEVVDWKRASTSTWTLAAKGGKPEHRAQVNAYAFLLGRGRWALCYINADKPDTLRVVRDTTDPQAAQTDLYSAVVVQKWIDAKEAPPRPDGMVLSRPPCLFCSYRARCEADGPEKHAVPEGTK